MATFYLICAIVGGVILLCQFLLTLIGIADGHDVDAGHGPTFDAHHDIGHHDADADHASSLFFSMLSFRALIAAVAFFGLGGLASMSSGLSGYTSLVGGAAAGSAAMLVVAWLMRTLYSLRAEGTVRIELAVGCTAVVYLMIPGHKTGAGKVTVQMQNRTMEYEAMTVGDALPTGAVVEVIGVLGPDTLEVAPVKNLGEETHAD